MDTNTDQINSPRTIAACYYTFLSLIATSIIQIVLHLLGYAHLIPLLISFAVSSSIAFFSGMLFGKKIIYSNPLRKFNCFLWGMALILFALPIFDFFLLFCIKDIPFKQYNFSNTLQDQFLIYLMLLIYSMILVGSWLSMIGGFAALYLRDNFVPNLLNYSSKNN